MGFFETPKVGKITTFLGRFKCRLVACEVLFNLSQLGMLKTSHGRQNYYVFGTMWVRTSPAILPFFFEISITNWNRHENKGRAGDGKLKINFARPYIHERFSLRQKFKKLVVVQFKSVHFDWIWNIFKAWPWIFIIFLYLLSIWSKRVTQIRIDVHKSWDLVTRFINFWLIKWPWIWH